MISILQSPPQIIAGRMPVVFKISTDHVGACRLLAAVNGFTDSIEPDGDGDATFDLCDYVRDTPQLALELICPVVHQSAVADTEFTFSERYGTPPTNNNELVTDTYRVMNAQHPAWKTLPGTLQQFLFANAPARPFLTYLPASDRKVFPDEIIQLYYLNAVEATPDFYLHYYIRTTDATPYQFTAQPVTGAYEYNVLQFDASPAPVIAWLAANHADKTLYSYRVRVMSANEVYSEERTFIINTLTRPNRRQLFFRNSLGTFDQVMLTGKASDILSVTRLSSARRQDPAAEQMPDRITWNTNEVRYFKAELGFMLPAQRLWLNELIISNEVYLVSGGKAVALELQGEKYTITADQQYLMSWPLEFRICPIPIIEKA